MPNQILRRRANESSHQSYTLGTGEITYITDNKFLAIGDSSQVGGFVVPKLTADKRTLNANGILYANATTTMTTSTAFTWDGTTLTVDGDLTFTGAQSITTSAGALTIQPASGSGLTVTLATTGDFAVNTNQLYVDTSAASVGINTTTPAQTLEIDHATGANIRLARTSNVAATSEPGKIEVYAPDASGNPTQVWGDITCIVDDATHGSEDASWRFRTQVAGSFNDILFVGTGGNVGIGTSTFGTNAVTVFSIKNGTAPTTGPADTVQFYSSDNAAGHTIPSFYCEGTDVLATGQADSASSVRIKFRINGTVVTLLAV